VEYLSKQLSCEPKDELVVVPFCDSYIYATKSSSFLGCCILGDICGIPEQPDGYITKRPYCIDKIIDCEVFQLVKYGVK
jgi:hypothetical protein